MAVEARENEALELELRIRKELTRTINREKELTEGVNFAPRKLQINKIFEEMDQNQR